MATTREPKVLQEAVVRRMASMKSVAQVIEEFPDTLPQAISLYGASDASGSRFRSDHPNVVAARFHAKFGDEVD